MERVERNGKQMKETTNGSLPASLNALDQTAVPLSPLNGPSKELEKR
jgi:hypothetical protein